MPQKSWAIGIDLGGTKTEVTQVDGSGTPQEKFLFPTNVKGGAEAIIKEIIAAVKLLIDRVGSPPVGVGIGVAGQVDAETGVVLFAPNLNWRDVPLRIQLSKDLGVPVTVLNDVRSAAWGEWLYGAGKGVDDLVCLFVGTGIGGGVVSGGHMLTGSSNTAGELGHITIDLFGPTCTCGNSGCLEALASGWAISRRIEEAIAEDPSSGEAIMKLNEGQSKKVNSNILRQAAQAGDPLAKLILEEVTIALIAGAVSLVNAFNPRRLILGGGVIRTVPDLVEKVRQGVRQRALAAATTNLEVLPVHFPAQAGVIGAAAVAMRKFGGKI